MTITLRRNKGTALTFDELDNNFSTLDGRTNNLNSLVSASLQGTTNVTAGTGIVLQPSVDATASSATIKLSKFLDASGQAAATATQYDVLTNVDLTATTASAGTTGIAYSSSTKTITYTPPDLTSFLTSSSSIDLSNQSLTGTLPTARLPNISLTSVTTVASQAAQLALTTEEGDVVIRSDENKSYIRNSGTADPHDMTNFSVLTTPDTDTTYAISVEQTDNTDTDPTLNLTPNQGSADTITIKGSGATTVTRTDSGESVTINTPAAPVTSVDGNTGVITTLQIGTSSTTALAVDTSLLALGTTSTTALAVDTSLLALGTTSTTALAGDTSLLQLGTTSTTALAGDTSLLQLGTSSTTALAGDTALLALGTSSTTALAGDTALLALGTSSTTALAGDTTFAFADITSKPTTISGYGITDALTIGTTATTAMAGNTTFAFADITSKPTTISGYGITDALAIGTSATTAMAGNTALSAIGGSLDLSSQVTGTLPVGNMAATALTTVQTAATQAAQLALTTEEGDVVVRTDENKTYMRNSGTADPHDMTNFTLLATPTDAVTSVDGNTGIVTTLQIGTSATTAMAGNTTFAFSDITSKPTTISGYGITDALAIGTSGTTAMAGNTTFAFADITSKPTTISGYGITDALAIGTSSTTALAGDTALLALGTSSTTALAGDTVVDNRLLEVAKSNASLNIGDKSWIKVATVTIDARYQYYSAQLAVVGTGAAEGVANEKVVAIRVKQQAGMSNAPLVEVTTYNNSNEDYDFGHVVAVNTVNETRVDIYFRADGPNSGAEIYRMAETATATVAWVTGFTANYVTSAPTNFVQGGVHEKWHSGNQAGIFGATNGILKANGSGVLSAAVAGTDYSTLALGTTSTTALAGDTALLALGTSSTTALAGDTALLALGTSSTTALAGDTALLALGTSSTTALAGDTALLALGTSSTTALAGDTALLALGTSSTTALAGDSTFSTLANSSTATDTITIGASGQTGDITIGNSTAEQTINIQAETPGSGQTQTINVGTGGSAGSTKTINIGTTNTSYHTKNINMGNSNTSSGTSSNITMYGTVLMDDATVAATHTIGGTTQTGTITLGRSTQTQTINIGTGNVASGKTKTINIGTSNSSGSTTNINIGPTNTSAVRAIDINGNLTVDGTTQFDHMVTFKSDASAGNVYDQIVSFQAKGTSSAWYEAARIATLGSGSAPSRMIIGQDDAALTFFDGFGSKYVYPANSDTGAGTNGVCDLGSYGARFKLGRFSSGTTTSSDRNEKRDIEELTAAELRVAVRCKPLLRKYRRIDAYEEKGEAARIHFGIMAQDLDDAFTAEGLDAHRYAMFMEDTWYEYEGGVVTYPTLEDIPEEHRAGATEHTAMGVRYEQLLAFMIAAL